MKSVIFVNAYTALPSELNQPCRIAEELCALGVETHIERGGLSSLDAFSDADFAVFLDKDRYRARIFDKKMRLFNRADAIELCDDKMLTHIALSGVVPMPKTLAGALCYSTGVPLRDDFLDTVEAEIGYPVVVKECYGSLGKGIFLARTREELRTLAQKEQFSPHLFQRYVGESAGRDLRVIVIGGKVVGGMKRTSLQDFRSNAELGGRGEPFSVGKEAEQIAVAAARALGLDYCGVDLLFGSDGYLLCEVNSNAFFGAFERTTGKNVAKIYAEYMIDTVKGVSV